VKSEAEGECPDDGYKENQRPAEATKYQMARARDEPRSKDRQGSAA
jgi:hypothetical protein